MQHATLDLPDGSAVRLRDAVSADLPRLVAMLADDQLGRTREHAGDDLGAYELAFEAITADPAHLLLVVEDDPGGPIAQMQLSFIPGLARGGALRGQIEAVRVAAEHRSRGIGAALFAWAIEESRRRGCALVQLTTDKSRADGHRFYERLGFVASHDGLKLALG